MRILQVHNYHALRGGSDIMFDTIVHVLQNDGHNIIAHTKDNNAIIKWRHKIKAAFSGIYSFESKTRLNDLIESFKPDLVNIHNFYPLFSSSIFATCDKNKIPVVLRVADYTAICPSSHFYRSGTVCELCSYGKEYNCIKHNCLGNIAKSTAYAARTVFTRKTNCYTNHVSAFFMPSQHVRDKYIANGFKPEKLHVINNAVDIPLISANPADGKYIAYVGRISPEKGIEMLIKAAEIAKKPILIAGDYSKSDLVNSSNTFVQFIGPLSRKNVYNFIRKAKAVVIPSLCMETFNISCAEAMANGIPPIAANIGALPELVEHEYNGLLFEPGNAHQLAKSIVDLWENDDKLIYLGKNAKAKAVNNFSKKIFLERLTNLYSSVIEKYSAEK